MKRISYDQLYVEVDKLYKRNFDPNDVMGINDWCILIAEFIKAVGWTEEQYVQGMFSDNDRITVWNLGEINVE